MMKTSKGKTITRTQFTLRQTNNTLFSLHTAEKELHLLQNALQKKFGEGQVSITVSTSISNLSMRTCPVEGKPFYLAPICMEDYAVLGDGDRIFDHPDDPSIEKIIIHFSY